MRSISNRAKNVLFMLERHWMMNAKSLKKLLDLVIKEIIMVLAAIWLEGQKDRNRSNHC